MAQFSLRSLLLLVVPTAAALKLFIDDGFLFLMPSFAMGFVIGAFASYLFQRRGYGISPFIGALTGAMVAEIVGIHVMGIHAFPPHYRPGAMADVSWYPVLGAFAGAAFSVLVGIRSTRNEDRIQ